MASGIPPSGTQAFGGSGKLPVSPGQVLGMTDETGKEVDFSKMTLAERAQVLQGAKIPTPEERAKQIREEAAALAMAKAQQYADQGLETPTVEAVDIESLPLDRQKFVLDAIQETRTSFDKSRSRVSLFEEEEVETAPTPSPNPFFVETEPVTPEPEPSPTPEAETPPALEEEKEEEEPTPVSATSAKYKICNWCGGDPDAKAPEPTEEDFLAYIAHIAGGRFEKEYNLYKGNLTVCFQNPTPREEAAVFIQLKQDEERGLPPSLLPQRLLDYRTLISLSWYRIKGQPIRHLVKVSEHLKSHPADAKDATPLPAIWEALEGSLFQDRYVLGKVSSYYMRFIALVAAIEAQSMDEDGFSKPVVGG